jgi:peroxiredoxin
MKNSLRIFAAAAAIAVGTFAYADDEMAKPAGEAATMTKETGTVAASPNDVKPVDVGAKAPTGALENPDGTKTDLAALFAEKPTVLIFYRGGWCPFCTAHLAAVAAMNEDLVKAGYQIIGVSPELASRTSATTEKHGLNFTLLGDPDAEVIKAYGLAFRLDDATLEKYKGYGIDLEVSSGGRTHHILPVPAAYIIDREGTIRWAHWNADYKARIDANELRDVATKVAEESKRIEEVKANTAKGG